MSETTGVPVTSSMFNQGRLVVLAEKQVEQRGLPALDPGRQRSRWQNGRHAIQPPHGGNRALADAHELRSWRQRCRHTFAARACFNEGAQPLTVLFHHRSNR